MVKINKIKLKPRLVFNLNYKIKTIGQIRSKFFEVDKKTLIRFDITVCVEKLQYTVKYCNCI